jgi:hypothetical protein
VYGKSANGSIVIARVSGISHPVPPNADLNYVRGVRQLSGEIAGDNTVSLAKAEEAREGTTVNQKLIDSTVGGSGS